MDSTDREIYRAAIQGDRDAFELIIRGSSRSLFAIAYGVLQNRGRGPGFIPQGVEIPLARARSGKISRLAQHDRPASRARRVP